MKLNNGYVLAIVAATLWGLSGTLAQPLFQVKNIDTEWLVAIRLLFSGVILLAISLFKNPSGFWAPWKRKETIIKMLSFSIFGMAAVQYTYFVAIKLSNAATATVLQYLGPIMIAIYYTALRRRLPARNEAIAIVLAILGTFFLVTHGSIDSLAISTEALIWGIVSAIALATYSILPVQLLKEFDSPSVIGWAMTVGGLIFCFVHPPWEVSGVWDAQTYFSVAFIVLLGSLAAFYAYLTAVKTIGAQVASLLACTEPLAATILAVLWLGVPFGLMDWLGTALIIATIFLLTTNKKTNL